MIDIHSHILPFVDDGSQDYLSSLTMLKNMVDEGYTDVVCTPHYRLNYKKTPQEIKGEFFKFYELVKKENIPVNLYLGQEVFITKDYKSLIKDGEVLTINDGKYILIEFEYNKRQDVANVVYEIKTMGYIPIVAHIERYNFLTAFDYFDIKNSGGLIQVNVDSIVGESKKAYFKRIKTLFKEGLVDFVATDIHENRTQCALKAYEFVAKKFGKDIADKTFIENAKKIIG